MTQLRFNRADNIDVSYNITLQNALDLNENFTIIDVTGINTAIERRMFYQFDKRNWTLNEFNFFAANNNLSVTISNEGGIITSYGVSLGGSITTRSMGLLFDIMFN